MVRSNAAPRVLSATVWERFDTNSERTGELIVPGTIR